MKMAITDKIKKIADAIRSKSGTTKLLTLDQMDDLIQSLETDALPDYEGIYKVVPSFETTILDTDEKSVRDDIIIQPIQVVEVTNQSDGKTLII